ncbi:DUF3006 domain-containing protein [Natronomonas sp.]|jgi:hypothetical protein|uniref:DUF3006 domain-containing protein n=1 Tax=Natronomonas sp. TaxID=2184060 RepID=UPI003989454E
MRHVLALSALVVIVAVVATAATVASGICFAERAPDRTAVVDRLGDDHAVLLLERGDGAPEQRVVDPGTLPASGRHEGAVLTVADGAYTHNRPATKARESTLSRWFDALAGRM